MTDYTTIDREQLRKHLGEIATIIRETDGVPAEVCEDVDRELSEINGAMHEIGKPIDVEQRRDGFEITVVHG